VIYVAGLFQGVALTWWNSVISARGRDSLEAMSWPEFKELVVKKFYPRNEIQKLEQEFHGLEMMGPTHQDYITRFQEVAQLVPHLCNLESKWIEHYIWGLAPQVCSTTIGRNPKTAQEAIEFSAALTDEAI
jgi:hypothetical protein